MNLGAAMAGGNGAQREHGFYPTPPEATAALLQRLHGWPRDVLEPSCGDGAMSRVLETFGYRVTSRDLIDRGYGETGVDFLTDKRPWTNAVITNPPFKLADKFILRAKTVGASHLALLLKTSFWSAAGRLKVWDEWPPYARLDLTWRLDFDGRGSPTMDCA